MMKYVITLVVLCTIPFFNSFSVNEGAGPSSQIDPQGRFYNPLYRNQFLTEEEGTERSRAGTLVSLRFSESDGNPELETGEERVPQLTCSQICGNVVCCLLFCNPFYNRPPVDLGDDFEYMELRDMTAPQGPSHNHRLIEQVIQQNIKTKAQLKEELDGMPVAQRKDYLLGLLQHDDGF